MAKKDEGYLLDGSGERVKSGSGEYARTGSYDDEEVTQNRMKAAEEKLARDVQKKLKDDSDSARVSKDAEQGAKAPTSSAKTSDGMDDSDRRRKDAESAPKRQDSVKTKPSVVTKEQLAKSGFDNLRDYMNAQKGLKRRGSSTTTTETKPVAIKPTAKPADKPAGLMATADKPADKPASKPAGRGVTRNSSPGFFERIRARGEKDLAERGMKKGGSINGIAKRGLTKCKTV